MRTLAYLGVLLLLPTATGCLMVPIPRSWEPLDPAAQPVFSEARQDTVS